MGAPDIWLIFGIYYCFINTICAWY